MASELDFFITVPRPLEPLLEKELIAMGITVHRYESGGVWVRGPLEWAYRICLRSRLAIRVLLKLSQFSAENEKELYGRVRQVRWLDVFDLKWSFVVDFQCSRSNITHSQFGAQKTKDAIVDQFKQIVGDRPNVMKENPDIRIHIYLKENLATVYLDLTGESLHVRGYRREQGLAPLKENLAAAILMLAQWNTSDRKGPLVDPFCGSGTFLIEAALMTANFSPGLLRKKFGFHAWKLHNPALFENEVAQAKNEVTLDRLKEVSFFGSDFSKKAIHSAQQNQLQIPFPFQCEWTVQSFEKSSSHGFESGTLICNPPYGERMGEKEEVLELYRFLGNHWKHHFKGWRAFLFTGDKELLKSVGLKTKSRHTLYNGPLEGRLAEYELF